MAEDPHAEARAEHVASLAAEVARVYVAAKLTMVASSTPLQIPGWFFTRLKDVLGDGLLSAAADLGTAAGRGLGLGADFDFSPSQSLRNFIGIAAGEQASAQFDALGSTLGKLSLADDLKADVEQAVDAAGGAAKADAETQVTNVTWAAITDAAVEAGMGTKTWHAGVNPRASHLAQDGQTVAIDERFANGQRFPGSPAPPAEREGCNCWMSYGKGDA
jgi:hypothetical protein